VSAGQDDWAAQMDAGLTAAEAWVEKGPWAAKGQRREASWAYAQGWGGALRNQAPGTVTAEQRLALARVFAGARSGKEHVAFYESNGSGLWEKALEEADEALAVLGLSVEP